MIRKYSQNISLFLSASFSEGLKCRNEKTRIKILRYVNNRKRFADEL